MGPSLETGCNLAGGRPVSLLFTPLHVPELFNVNSLDLPPPSDTSGWEGAILHPSINRPNRHPQQLSYLICGHYLVLAQWYSSFPLVMSLLYSTVNCNYLQLMVINVGFCHFG